MMRYKIGWFQGDAQVPERTITPYMSQDEINALDVNDRDTPILRILLIPENASLTELKGDDFNDAPANCNASHPYYYPEGSVWVNIPLGGVVNIDPEEWLTEKAYDH